MSGPPAPTANKTAAGEQPSTRSGPSITALFVVYKESLDVDLHQVQDCQVRTTAHDAFEATVSDVSRFRSRRTLAATAGAAGDASCTARGVSKCSLGLEFCLDLACPWLRAAWPGSSAPFALANTGAVSQGLTAPDDSGRAVFGELLHAGRHWRPRKPDMDDPELGDPFAHLKQRASERADRTVERIRAGITVLQATGRKIAA